MKGMVLRQFSLGLGIEIRQFWSTIYPSWGLPNKKVLVTKFKLKS